MNSSSLFRGYNIEHSSYTLNAGSHVIQGGFVALLGCVTMCFHYYNKNY